VLSVGDGVTDDTLKEGLEDEAGLLVDHCGEDALGRVHKDEERCEGGTYWQRYA
jgi:hypothetical protein